MNGCFSTESVFPIRRIGVYRGRWGAFSLYCYRKWGEKTVSESRFKVLKFSLKRDTIANRKTASDVTSTRGSHSKTVTSSRCQAQAPNTRNSASCALLLYQKGCCGATKGANFFMAKRNAQGNGSLRHRPDALWEARYTFKDELGQPQRGSVYAKTQKECRQKLTNILQEIDDGCYQKPVKQYTVSQWMKEWLKTYCMNLKPRTIDDYTKRAEKYIIPNFGKVKLTALTPVQIQRFCNKLSKGYKQQKPLSPKSVQNIHGVLHAALEQAFVSGVIVRNPADNTKLPKTKKPALKPLMDDSIPKFLEAIKGDAFERVYITDLFSGLRQSEILGLQWGDINFEEGEITVCRQLQKSRTGKGYIFLDETKSGKDRTIAVAPAVMDVLKEQKRQQTEWKLAAGQAWNNEHDLVFTNELGEHLCHSTVYHHFKKLVKQIGMDETRFHDLRHSTAIMALQNGCSPKLVQQLLGHFSAGFTMDVYGAVSKTMQKDSQERMQKFIEQVSNL